MNAQTKVHNTKSISIAANKLLRKPNYKGANIKLNKRFKINGKATNQVICLLANLTKTAPKETAIIIYNTVQTGPNSQEDGAQEGFINCWYQLYDSINLRYIYLDLSGRPHCHLGFSPLFQQIATNNKTKTKV